MQMRVIVIVISGLCAVAALLVPGTVAWSAQPASTSTAEATEPPTPTPPFAASLLAQADLPELPEGVVAVSVVSTSLPAETELLPFTTAGPVLIAVQKGAVVMTANQDVVVSNAVPILGILQPYPPTPGPLDETTVPKEQQVLISAGTEVVLTNPGPDPATIIVLTIEPATATADSTPSASGTPITPGPTSTP